MKKGFLDLLKGKFLVSGECPKKLAVYHLCLLPGNGNDRKFPQC